MPKYLLWRHTGFLGEMESGNLGFDLDFLRVIANRITEYRNFLG